MSKTPSLSDALKPHDRHHRHDGNATILVRTLQPGDIVIADNLSVPKIASVRRTIE